VEPAALNQRQVVRYLRTGAAAGMKIPDPSDPTLTTFRVVR
jgi:hypothetical protein